MKTAKLLEAHAAIRGGIELVQCLFELVPIRAFSRKKTFEIDDHGSASEQLPLLHTQILRDQFRAEALVLEQRKLHTTPLQYFTEFAQVMPKQMAAQMLINPVERRDIRVSKHRSNAGRGQHVDHDQVLAPDQLHVPHKAFRNHGIVQRGEKEQESATAKPKSDKSADLVEVRRDDFGLERV